MVIGEVFCPYCGVWQNNLSPVGWLLDRSHGNTRGSDWLLADSSPHTKCWMLSLLGTKSLGNMTVELNCLGILDISQLAIIQHGPIWWQTSQQGHKGAWKEVDKAQNMVSFVWFGDDNDELTIQMRCRIWFLSRLCGVERLRGWEVPQLKSERQKYHRRVKVYDS